MKRVLLSLLFGLTLHSTAFATWSVIALDKKTGQVAIAAATCVSQARFRTFPSEGIKDILAVVVPGKGVAACQAGVDLTRKNQQLVFEELNKGTDPAQILEMLKQDPQIERRQFGILDMQGRHAGFNGKENQQSSLFRFGQVGDDIFYQIQGNILFSDDVVHNAALKFTQTKGTLADRVMAAMEGADERGGDRRCTCETEPRPNAPCDGKTSHVAYILISDKTDPNGSSYNNGKYFAYISVTDEEIKPNENANPMKTLRMRYDAWKKAGAKRMTSAN
jgi:uncharacterized Ntn-hydrolase superfamily protein